MECKKLMRRVMFTLIFLSLIYSLSANSTAEADLDQAVIELYIMTVDTITPEVMMKMENYHLFDIRSLKEFEVSHIDGAELIEYKKFDIEDFPKIPRDEPIILYCTIGYRSERIGEDLKEVGYTKVYNLYGGLIHWVNSGYPVVKDGIETDRVHGYSRNWSRFITNPDIIVE